MRLRSLAKVTVLQEKRRNEDERKRFAQRTWRGVEEAVHSLISVPSKPQQPSRIPLVDLLPIRLGDRQAVDVLDRLADVERALLGIEREVTRKDHSINAEELEAAFHRVPRTKERRVGVEHLEIVIRSLLQSLQIHRQIFVVRPRAELIEARPDATGKIGNHPSHVVRDDLQTWPAI